MKFDELNQDNWSIFAIKNYNNHYWYMNCDFWNDTGPTHYWIHGHCNAGAQIGGFRFDKRGGPLCKGKFTF